MKRITALALGATLMVATASGAVAQERDRGDRRGRHEDVRDARQAPMRGLLRGITLSDAQKEQVKAIRERYQPRYKALRDSLRPAAEQARAARQRGDTAAARAAWAESAEERAQMMVVAQQQADEIRALLTPDQQTVFDQNLAAWRERGREAARDAARGSKRGRRGRPGAT